MRRFASTIRELFGRRTPATRKHRRPARSPLQLEMLEDRSVPSANTALISGTAFIDTAGTGVLSAQEATLPGVAITLTGKSTDGSAISMKATTNGNGVYNFANVLPGTYEITAGPVTGLGGGSPATGGQSGTQGDVLTGLTVAAGQSLTENFGFQGLAATGISLRLFLSSSTPADLPFTPTSPTPFLKTAIANVSVAAGSSPTTIDLAGHFLPAVTGQTTVQLLTSDGPINIQLFDGQAPQTVANFLNYVQSGRYNDDIFHRLVSNFVLQGGGFTLTTNPTSLVPVVTDPAVQNEFNLPNIQGTVALAKLGNDPNSGTSQFFFNLTDNTKNLDNQNGGFTVFGKIVGASDQQVLTTLAGTTIKDESGGSSASAFGSIPMNNYSGTNFPTDATPSNFLVVNDAYIANQGDTLTYSIIANSNPKLVTPSLNNERLVLTYTPGQTGTANITVRATSHLGATLDTSFTVTVK
jgi:cyclophilin family peptidyl-prolyl cis-trans isomerase